MRKPPRVNNAPGPASSGPSSATSIPEGYTSAAAVARILAKYVTNIEQPSRPRPLSWDAIDTVILDLDGTLLDLHFDQTVWNSLLPQRFADAFDCSIEEAKQEVAKCLRAAQGTLAWYCLDHWTERLGIDLANLEIELAHLVRPRPGAIWFLQTLATAGRRLILATNAHPSSMRRKFRLTGIDHYFDSIGCSHDYGICKEDPAFWPAFTDDLAIEPARTLLIDDNHAVLRAAAQFGIATVYGVQYPDTRGPQVTSPEFHCIDSFEELIQGTNRRASIRLEPH